MYVGLMRLHLNLCGADERGDAAALEKGRGRERRVTCKRGGLADALQPWAGGTCNAITMATCSALRREEWQQEEE